MEAVIKNTIRTPAGSILTSVVVHGAIYGALALMLGMSFFTKAPAPQGEVELGYEVLDEPPAPSKVVHRIARSEEPKAPVDPVAKPDHTPKELQDEKSDIAGTQAAAKQQANLGSTSDGDANATPYYKIKPKYPRAALVEGVEGWVLMKVDITEAGEVQNVRVIGGEKRDMFELEARRAVEKWKYRPFVDASGHPFRKTDHQVKVEFKLSEASS